MATNAAKLIRCCSLSAVVVAALLAVDVIILAIWWPFKEPALVQALEDLSSSEVHVGSYRRIYFPHPGYIADNITFSRRSNGEKVELASLRRMTGRASWVAMVSFTRCLAELRLGGLHVVLPSNIPSPIKFDNSSNDKMTVTTLVADGSVLEIAGSSASSQKLRFEFPRLTLGNVEKKKSMTIQMLAHLPEPPGDLAVTGRFGPLDSKNVGGTPVGGTFRLIHADLSAFQGIRGTLSSGGSFRGTLAKCEVRGDAQTPDFELTSTQHSVALRVQFDVLVNGLQGDVSIQSADAHLLHTVLLAQGTVRGTPGQKGKTVRLNIEASQARVEDLLRLFTKTDPPALNGPITLHAKAVLPPSEEPFARRVQLDGNFAIEGAEFEHGDTQEKVDQLSERAQKKAKDPKGSDPPLVLSDLESRVDLRDGTATLSQAKFATPGAVAQGGGTYDLLTERVNLHGQLAMQASLSKAAGGGMKSILLLPLDPFFKKKHEGAVLPVEVTGVFPHPAFKVSLTGKH